MVDAIQFDLPAAEYFAAPGLSFSGMKDLAVSPYRYWYLHINPERPKDEPTPEMRVGSAVHCAVLEPGQFDARYACEVEPPADCLRTISDIRAWIESKGEKPKGQAKGPLIDQALLICPDVPILDMLKAQHEDRHAGKTIFKAEDWARINGAAKSLLEEPTIQAILSDGKPEVSMFRRHEETGVMLKSRMDWVAPKLTMDVKTFTQKRGKSIDDSVTEAIWWEGYYKQAFTYGLVRGWPKEFNGEFVFAFVESEPPFETRIRTIRPKNFGEVCMLWERARHEVSELIRTYAKCMKHFGEKPWRYAQEASVLDDMEMKWLAFS